MENRVSVDVGALHGLDPENEYVEALGAYPYMMKPDEVAEFLGQTRQAVTGFLRDGTLRGVKSGASWRVSKFALIKFLKDNEN